MSEQAQKSLYQKHIPIVTRSVKGRFRTFKTAVMLLAYSVYFLLPWMPWHRVSAASQAILFDLPTRRFFIFNLTVYPQDIFWLAMLLFIAAALLFFVTGLVGRAWCGYFCFQTLWSDLFIQIEHLIQGERPARIRLKTQDWDLEKIFKLSLSHALMILVSFWTAVTFACYFSYAPSFVLNFFNGTGQSGGYVTVLVLTSLTYMAGGVAREQICLYACPYARFQGVMYEADTLAVTYDTKRGEGLTGRTIPIHGLKTHEERTAAGHGDCIDCGFCVQVCPTGIDIRNGMQYQCISCGLCIDACDNIMDSVGYPRGLIRYDSERNMASEVAKPPKVIWARFKVLGYAGALILMTSLLFYNIGTRSDSEITVQQERQPLYVMLSDGSFRNRYVIHIVNKTELDQIYTIDVEGVSPRSLDMRFFKAVTIKAGKGLRMNATVNLSAEDASEVKTFNFLIRQAASKEVTKVATNFNSPREHD